MFWLYKHLGNEIHCHYVAMTLFVINCQWFSPWRSLFWYCGSFWHWLSRREPHVQVSRYFVPAKGPAGAGFAVIPCTYDFSLAARSWWRTVKTRKCYQVCAWVWNIYWIQARAGPILGSTSLFLCAGHNWTSAKPWELFVLLSTVKLYSTQRNKYSWQWNYAHYNCQFQDDATRWWTGRGLCHTSLQSYCCMVCWWSVPGLFSCTLPTMETSDILLVWLYN